MLPFWFIIAFSAELLWVTGNVIDKILITKLRNEQLNQSGVGTLVLFSVFFSIIVCFLIAIFHPSIVLHPLVVSIGIVAGILNALYIYLYLNALEHTEVSRAVPVFQTVPIFGLFFGFIFLNEFPTINQLISSLIILSGAFILSYNFREKNLKWFPLFLMVSSSASLALQETIFKFAAIESDFWTTAFWMNVGVVIFGTLLYLCIPVYRKQFIFFIRNLKLNILTVYTFNEIIDVSAMLLVSYALILGPVVLVQTVSAYQPLLLLIVTTLIGILTNIKINEDTESKALKQKILGVGIITVGSILLYTNI